MTGTIAKQQLNIARLKPVAATSAHYCQAEFCLLLVDLSHPAEDLNQ
jgi:hypothetical protein